eukprot:991436_1
MFSLRRVPAFHLFRNAISPRYFSASSVSQSDVAFFQKEGYLSLENFFDEQEFRAIRAGLVKLRNNGRLANVATEGDGVTHTTISQNLQLCPLSPELSLFKSLPFHPKVGEVMSKLLHDDTIDEEQDICCYLSQTFWKPAKHGAGTGWHQDNAYFLFEKPQFSTALWIPIHKSTKVIIIHLFILISPAMNIQIHQENGTMMVVKGFAKAQDEENGTPIEHLRDGGSDHHVSCKGIIESAYMD